MVLLLRKHDAELFYISVQCYDKYKMYNMKANSQDIKSRTQNSIIKSVRLEFDCMYSGRIGK